MEFGIRVADGDLSFERFKDLHFSTGEAEALRLGRDLEAAADPLHDIVIADAALVMEAADAIEICGSGTPSFFHIARSTSEAAVDWVVRGWRVPEPPSRTMKSPPLVAISFWLNANVPCLIG